MDFKNKDWIRLLWKELLLFFIALFMLFQVLSNLHILREFMNDFFTIISPFIIGAIMAYFLSRPVANIEIRLKKADFPFLRKRARGFAVLIVLLILVLIVTVILSLIMPVVVSNILDFSNQLGTYSRSFLDWLNGFILDLEQDDSWVLAVVSRDDLMHTLTELFSVQRLLSELGTHAASIVTYIMALSSSVINAVISVIICLYSLIFKDSILAFVDRLAKAFISTKKLELIKFYLQRSNEFFYKFIVAQFMDACVLGTLATLLLFVLGVEYALMLGVLLGVCNMIPYFGSMFGSIVTAIITIFTGGLQLALITALSLLILQQIDGNFIGPRIMGDALKLNPMLIIIAITIGGAYFGILGMFLSVPVVAMLKLFVNDLIALRERTLADKAIKEVNNEQRISNEV